MRESSREGLKKPPKEKSMARPKKISVKETVSKRTVKSANDLSKSRSKESIKRDLKGDEIADNIKNGLLRISTAMRSQAWKWCEQKALTPTQSEILCLLKERNTLRLKDIAVETALTAATTSDAVTTLEEKNLVIKRRDINDGRALAVTLTKKGSDLADRTHKSCWTFISESASKLKFEEQALMYRSLVKLVNDFEESDKIANHRSCLNCVYFKPSEAKQKLDTKVTSARSNGTDSSKNYCSFYKEEYTDAHIRLDCYDFSSADVNKCKAAKKIMWKHV